MEGTSDFPASTVEGEASETQDANVSAELFSGSPISKEEENEEIEECSVCRNELTERTTLSDCVHEFCYECIVGWLTRGSGQFCPMCKTPVKFIKRKGSNEEITLEQLKTDVEPEATASADLVTEKRIVSRKIRSCRRLMNRIDEIIAATSNRTDATKRAHRAEEFRKMKQSCVDQLNSLQMLRDEIDHGALKPFIVSRPEFRRLIYERLVTSARLPNANRMITTTELLNNIEHYRTVLHAFLKVELKSIPAKKQPRVDSDHNNWYFYTVHDVAAGQDDEMINKIFSLISDRGVACLNEDDICDCLNDLITRRSATVFLNELKSLVNSKQGFIEWCGTVTYRIKTDVGGESGDGNEVFTVDDSIEVEPSDDRPYHFRSNRYPVFTPFDNIFAQSSSQGFRNHRRASSSDTDQDEDIYFQAPLRIGPMASNPFRPAPHPAFPPIPTAGSNFWNELTRNPNNAPRTAQSNVPVVSLDDEEDKESENDSDSEIQVVEDNSTIVLDDTVESSSNQAKRRRRSDNSSRKRKADDKDEFSFEDQWKKQVKLEMIPDGLIEDIQELINKYKLPLINALDILDSASKEAMKKNANESQKAKSLKEAINRLTDPSSSNIRPDQALQLAGYMARTGRAFNPQGSSNFSTRGDGSQ